MRNDDIKPFKIEIGQELLSDLAQRLRSTRWTHQVEDAGWDAGTDLGYLRELTHYWIARYDWRERERWFNRFHHYKADVDGVGIHFIHERGQGKNPFPLILTHGYPDSSSRFLKIIPMLTHPEAFGGNEEDSFDVIVPDLPGYGFSDKPDGLGAVFGFGDLLSKLMVEKLGYERFGAHGGDLGSAITEQMAHHSSAVAAIHLTDIPFGHYLQKPKDLRYLEKKFFEENDQWMQKEAAYAMLQSTKPQSLAQSLNDSPTGLAAWMIEKYRSWSDCHGDIESRFSKDELLDQVMIYWLTSSIGSAFLPYFDWANAGALTWMKEGVKQMLGPSAPPAAFALFPQDISHPPREFAERFFNVQRWTEMPRGGHFAAMEEPQLLVEDIRTWFRAFRENSVASKAMVI